MTFLTNARTRLAALIAPPAAPLMPVTTDQLQRLRQEHAAIYQTVQASKEWQRMCYLQGQIDLLTAQQKEAPHDPA